MHELLASIAVAAVVGAQDDPRSDKSDWIRIWVLTRRQRGLDDGPVAWQRAYERHEEP